mgnify:CR=1 FL=1
MSLLPTLTVGQAWGLLAVAIGFEVAGTTCMRLSEGFSRWLPSVLIFVFYAASFALNTLIIGRLGLSVVYAVWSGVGTVATALIGSLVHAVSGGALYRKSSFLLDSLGKQVMSPRVSISERPHLRGGFGSSYFDNEGVATRDREIVTDGVLQGYFLSTYSARKLGLQTTGNAGGSHNLVVKDGELDFTQLARQMHRGLIVTELLGHGVNYVTGDYSRGAAGFWVEDGQIQHPVEEITIAGNLREMFMGISAIGNDALPRGAKHCGSILIDRMTVAGS